MLFRSLPRTDFHIQHPSLGRILQDHVAELIETPEDADEVPSVPQDDHDSSIELFYERC